MLRAILDANVPKFLMDDLELFNGIVFDLFPKIKDVPVNYEDVEKNIRSTRAYAYLVCEFATSVELTYTINTKRFICAQM